MRKASSFSLWNSSILRTLLAVQMVLSGIRLVPWIHGFVKLDYAVGVIFFLFSAAIFLEYERRIMWPVGELSSMLQSFLKTGVLDPEISFSEKEDMIEIIRRIIHSMDSISLKQKNAEILMKNAEINNLQDQINPHFLYNTLEVIRGEALTKGERKIADMTAALANYFRYNISHREVFVHLEDELKNSLNYFKIQQHRFRDKISCEIHYLDVAAEEVGLLFIPKLILQPIIENAIYHGLELKLGPGTITILISADETMLRICIEDDGLGMTAEKLAEINSGTEMPLPDGQSHHNGVALDNIRKRLKLYWGEQAFLYAESQQNVGTRFHLCMPKLETPPVLSSPGAEMTEGFRPGETSAAEGADRDG